MPMEAPDAPAESPWVVRDLPGWHYAVTVVDLDAKPASKIPYYFQQDREIATLFAQHLLRLEQENRAELVRDEHAHSDAINKPGS
jgi:hypothetical protein